MADDWLTPRRFAVVLGLLVFATFPSVLLGSQTFVFRDFGLFSYPVAFYQRQCFWRGELPLWNPLSQCGLPFLAQWNTLTLYPPALVYLLLPLTWALPVFCLGHVVWGGLGMYLLAQRWTQHRLAAALAGVIFAFNGLTMNFLAWPSHIATFSWVSWVWLLGPEAWRRGGKKLVWAVAAAALQMLAGGPETLLSTWLILVVLAVGDWLRREAPRTRIAARFAALAGMVALLCAVQLLPFLQLLANSQRHSGYGSAGWSMPAWGWANFLVPLFRTSPTPQGVYLQDGQGWTSSYYAGIGTVWLALVAVRRVRDWRVRTLGVLVAACLLLALGNNGVLYPLLRACVPVVGFARFPIKFVIPILALAPLLAAFGLAVLLGGEPPSQSSAKTTEAARATAPAGAALRRPPGVFEYGLAVVLVVLIGAILVLDEASNREVWRTTATNGLARGAFLGLFLFLCARVAKAADRLRLLYGCLLLLVVWLDFKTHVPSQNPTASPEIYTPGWVTAHAQWNPRPSLGQSRAFLGPEGAAELQFQALPNLEQTYLGHRLGLFADCNLLDGIPQVHGFFSLLPGAINDVTTLPYAEPAQDFTPLLDFMGVSQISSPEKILEWVARPSAMQLVTAGQRPIFADDSTACASFTNPAVSFRKVVFLPKEAAGATTATGQPEATVKSLVWTDRSLSFQTEAAGAAVAVIAQSYYPVWKAYVDDKPVNLWRANYAFQAVQVPAGRHEVRLAYEDRLLHVGVVLSALGVAALVGLWVLALSGCPKRRN